MKNKIYLTLALLFSTIQASHAGGNSSSAATDIVNFYRWHTGLLASHPVMRNPDACERSDFYILAKDHPYYKELVALIMASHLARQPIMFNVDGCFEGFPVIQHVISKLE